MPINRLNPQDWFAIVVKIEPDIVLAIDRSLIRAWMTVRLAYPDIHPEELAFRTMSECEFDAMPETGSPPNSVHR